MVTWWLMVLFGCGSVIMTLLWWRERDCVLLLEERLDKLETGRAVLQEALGDALVREQGLADDLMKAAQVVERAKKVIQGDEYQFVTKLPVVKRPGGGYWSQN